MAFICLVEQYKQDSSSTFSNVYKYSGAPIYSRHVKSEILTMLKDSTYTEVAKFDSDLSIINMEKWLI